MNGRVRAVLLFAVALLLLPLTAAVRAGDVEIREYEGRPLDPFKREYDNSIRGPQRVDAAAYRLRIHGKVEKPLELTYEEVLALGRHRRSVTLNCVEGWSERLLWDGVRLADLFARAGARDGVTTVIFRAVDGYSSSLAWDFVKSRDLLLAFAVNGRTLDAARGFPFQVVAEDKYGYKWVRWVGEIELSDQPYSGHWESVGYDNDADLPPERRGNGAAVEP